MIRSFASLLLAGTLFGQSVLPEGTKVQVKLNQNVSSSSARAGQEIEFTVAEDVLHEGRTIIPQGSRAVGVVLHAQAKRRMGRGGKLDFTAERIRTPEGKSIPLRHFPQGAEGGGKGATVGILTAATAVAFFPAAPFVLLMKGKDIEIPRGTVFSVFTDAPFRMDTPPNPRAAEVMPVPLGQFSKVEVHSSHPDAEVFVNDRYFGNAPSSLNLAPGQYRVSVRVAGQSWDRDVELSTGNSLTLKANFPSAVQAAKTF